MLIDWFTVAAQLVNFLLLIWLLKRFLYQPIQNAIDAREQQTNAIINDAAKLKQQAEQQLHTYTTNNQQLTEQRQALLDEANKQALEERNKLLNEARIAAEQLRTHRIHALDQELTTLKLDLAKQNLHEIYAISDKLLRELADENLQQQMLNRFVQRINNASNGELWPPQQGVEQITPDSNSVITVRSQFTLTDQQRDQIQQCLNQALSAYIGTTAPLTITYQQDDQLICGIEVTIDGWKLAWSERNYLDLLQQQMDKLSPLPDTQPPQESQGVEQ